MTGSPTLVAHSVAGGIGASPWTTSSIACAKGDAIYAGFLAIPTAGAIVSGITDTGGNTYSKLGFVQSSTGQAAIEIWRADNVTPGSGNTLVLTVTMAAALGGAYLVADMSPTPAPSLQGKGAGTKGTPYNSGTDETDAVVPASLQDAVLFVMGVVTHETTTADTITFSNGTHDTVAIQFDQKTAGLYSLAICLYYAPATGRVSQPTDGQATISGGSGTRLNLGWAGLALAVGPPFVPQGGWIWWLPGEPESLV